MVIRLGSSQGGFVGFAALVAIALLIASAIFYFSEKSGLETVTLRVSNMLAQERTVPQMSNLEVVEWISESAIIGQPGEAGRSIYSGTWRRTTAPDAAVLIAREVYPIGAAEPTDTDVMGMIGNLQTDQTFRVVIYEDTADGSAPVIQVFPEKLNGVSTEGFGAPEDGVNSDDAASASCFSGATPVLVRIDGEKLHYQRIDSLRPGDFVLSVSDAGSEARILSDSKRSWSEKWNASMALRSSLEPAEVATVIVHPVPNEGALEVSLSSGRLLTTKSHPMFFLDQGWFDIRSLGTGVFVGLNGNFEPVLKTKKLQEKMPLYNLHLKENFTYFVLPDGASEPLWVHNAQSQSTAKQDIKGF